MYITIYTENIKKYIESHFGIFNHPPKTLNPRLTLLLLLAPWLNFTICKKKKQTLIETISADKSLNDKCSPKIQYTSDLWREKTGRRLHDVLWYNHIIQIITSPYTKEEQLPVKRWQQKYIIKSHQRGRNMKKKTMNLGYKYNTKISDFFFFFAAMNRQEKPSLSFTPERKKKKRRRRNEISDLQIW